MIIMLYRDEETGRKYFLDTSDDTVYSREKGKIVPEENGKLKKIAAGLSIAAPLLTILLAKGSEIVANQLSNNVPPLAILALITAIYIFLLILSSYLLYIIALRNRKLERKPEDTILSGAQKKEALIRGEKESILILRNLRAIKTPIIIYILLGVLFCFIPLVGLLLLMFACFIMMLVPAGFLKHAWERCKVIKKVLKNEF